MSSSVLKCISSALIQSLHSFSISDLFTQEYNPHSQEIYNLVGDCHRYCGFSSVQFSSVAQSCLTLCDPMSRSTPGLPVHHQLWSLPKFMSIELVMPSSHLILCHPPSPPALNLFQHQDIFK